MRIGTYGPQYQHMFIWDKLPIRMQSLLAPNLCPFSLAFTRTMAHSSVKNSSKYERSNKRLEELGYRPEFKREMSLFGVLGISFCAIGILTGMSSALQTGLFSGGPLGLFWGWNVSNSLSDTAYPVCTQAFLRFVASSC